MKARKIIYTIIGIFLIVINLLVDIVSPDRSGEYQNEGTSYSIAYFIGAHIFIIIGLILLLAAYRLNKKIKSRDEDSEIRKAIDELGRQ